MELKKISRKNYYVALAITTLILLAVGAYNMALGVVFMVLLFYTFSDQTFKDHLTDLVANYSVEQVAWTTFSVSSLSLGLYGVYGESFFGRIAFMICMLTIMLFFRHNRNNTEDGHRYMVDTEILTTPAFVPFMVFSIAIVMNGVFTASSTMYCLLQSAFLLFLLAGFCYFVDGFFTSVSELPNGSKTKISELVDIK